MSVREIENLRRSAAMSSLSIEDQRRLLEACAEVAAQHACNAEVLTAPTSWASVGKSLNELQRFIGTHSVAWVLDWQRYQDLLASDAELAAAAEPFYAAGPAAAREALLWVFRRWANLSDDDAQTVLRRVIIDRVPAEQSLVTLTEILIGT